MKKKFSRIATATAEGVGSPYTFVGAVIIVLVWLISGPVFGFSDTWQLLINTTTTIVTNLIVFLIQNTENRNSFAIHLKLDEVLRALPKAKEMFDIENMSEDELKELHKKIGKKIK